MEGDREISFSIGWQTLTSSNFIGNFEVDGIMLRVEDQVNECIVSFYENLYDKLC